MTLTEETFYTLIETQFHQPKGTVASSTQIDAVMKDSMDVMEFMAILANEYDIRLDPANMHQIKTIGELLKELQTTR